ncbi:type II toxin-antitoxin system HicB family antitoxin [Sphaerotilus sp.]|jgi:antitoxin HicB|uniref:type II toxin-antitoxin system HicB family antitoxin n=1 Tax=Sphaerotilus sp. TaxID=2093942 RepID=UPI0025E0DFA9|nr:hypothetical protein [Sphaerotilus sp.]
MRCWLAAPHVRIVAASIEPEVITFGADEDEALLQAVDALETGLSFYIEACRPLPVASAPQPGLCTARPSARECTRLGVYRAMTDSPMNPLDN